MQDVNTKTETRSENEKLVLMYPGNQLKAQVRSYEETLSAFKVLKETFFQEA